MGPPSSFSDSFNPIALRKAKLVNNFGLSECKRVKKGNKFYDFLFALVFAPDNKSNQIIENFKFSVDLLV